MTSTRGIRELSASDNAPLFCDNPARPGDDRLFSSAQRTWLPNGLFDHLGLLGPDATSREHGSNEKQLAHAAARSTLYADARYCRAFVLDKGMTGHTVRMIIWLPTPQGRTVAIWSRSRDRITAQIPGNLFLRVGVGIISCYCCLLVRSLPPLTIGQSTTAGGTEESSAARQTLGRYCECGGSRCPPDEW